MFVKTIEFVMFQQNKLKAYTCVDKKFISVLTHVLALGLGILFISLTAQYLVRSCLFGVAYFFIIYWFVSIFTYLYKKSLFGTYTRIIQRF